MSIGRAVDSRSSGLGVGEGVVCEPGALHREESGVGVVGDEAGGIGQFEQEYPRFASLLLNRSSVLRSVCVPEAFNRSGLEEIEGLLRRMAAYFQ
jgi:hypothetical protein